MNWQIGYLSIFAPEQKTRFFGAKKSGKGLAASGLVVTIACETGRRCAKLSALTTHRCNEALDFQPKV